MISRIPLADGYEISRVIKGGWQLSGDHGTIDHEQALHDMAAFVEAGITTFDCADIYTNAEMLIGRFRARFPSLAMHVQVHTKFVPDLKDLGRIDADYVRRGIARSLERLKLDRLHLVQFHWWDYAVPGYVEVALELAKLQRQGLIEHLGVTNFDVPRLREMIDAGAPIVSNQIQYSILDARAEHGMAALCQEKDLHLLCYGTIAGGFLSERWLGAPEPAEALTNRSLVKYKLVIEEFGGWSLFQGLLQVLSNIAVKHRCEIATVASKYVLERDRVAAVIVGATNALHLRAHAQIENLQFDIADRAAIDAVLVKRRGPPGDVYTLERDREGPHGRHYEIRFESVTRNPA